MNIENIKSAATLSNGIKMPVLGLGVYKAEEGEEVIKAIHYALDAGYRHFDTASFYQNEKGVGEAIRSYGIAREEVFITSKVWIDDQGFENTLKAFEVSNKELGLDYIDLYLIHWPVPDKYLESWKALEKLYAEKRVKAIGVCNCLQHHLNELLEKGEVNPMVLQNEFHPRIVQQPLLNFCKENEIKYEAWSPLMRGKILNNDVLKKLALKYNKSVAQILIRWDLQKGVVTIPKSTNKERIRENSNVFDFQISEEDIKHIDSLETGERTGAHPDHFLEYFKG